MISSLAWHTALLLFLWVPFAVVAGVVDTWNTDGGRRMRMQLRDDVLHPVRTYRLYRVTHAHAH